MLHQSGTVTPPIGREAWSHEDTPRMVRLHLISSIKSRKNRDTILSDLSFLYKLRVQSDYVSAVQSTFDVDMVAKKARINVHIAEGVLSEGR